MTNATFNVIPEIASTKGGASVSAQDGERPVETRRVDLRRIQLHSRRLVTGDLLGQFRSAFRGTGLVYTDIRPYYPGDPVKHIHWKATAKSGHVYVKSFEEDRQLRVILAIDASASMRAPHNDVAQRRAVAFAALIGALTLRSNDLLGMTLFAEQPLLHLPPKSGLSRSRQVPQH